MGYPEKQVTFINSDPSTAIAESITHMPNPLDPNAPPIKIKRKPGRKPNPASPDMRKAQNRAAQRAFRERKERHLKELEDNIKTLNKNHSAIRAQLEATIQEKQKVIDSLQDEKEYLKAFVLSLQTTLDKHGIQFTPPPPTAVAAATSASAATVASFPEPLAKEQDTDIDSEFELSSPSLDRDSPAPPHSPAAGFEDVMMSSILPDTDVDTDTDTDIASTTFLDTDTFGFLASNPVSPNPDSFTDSFYEFSNQLSVNNPILPPPSPLAPTSLEPVLIANEPIDIRPLDTTGVPPLNITAIQMIKMQLMFQEASSKAIVPHTIKPTYFQIHLPHDPRIDMIPCPGLRDRMIIFQHQYDLDVVIDMLIKKAIYHGDDPTDPACWELPEEFFEEYWFLCVDANAERTNRWRKARGAPTLRLRQSETDLQVLSKLVMQP